MGAVLYEMLTGTVPFVGASPSEILMKHLSAEPDCTASPSRSPPSIKQGDGEGSGRAIPERAGNGRGRLRRRARSQQHVGVPRRTTLSMVAGRVATKLAGRQQPAAAELPSIGSNADVADVTVGHRQNDHRGKNPRRRWTTAGSVLRDRGGWRIRYRLGLTPRGGGSICAWHHRARLALFTGSLRGWRRGLAGQPFQSAG